MTIKLSRVALGSLVLGFTLAGGAARALDGTEVALFEAAPLQAPPPRPAPSQTPAQPARPAGQPVTAQSLAPYVPTPQDVVDRMLALAEVTPKDVVYDLGCGDGRLVITAAKRFGAHGVGVDIDPERIAESETNAKREGVEKLVAFKLQDAMTVDVSPASVVTLYLLSSSNMRLRPMLTRELRAGSRIVSHAFSMGDWEPAKVDTFKDANGSTRTLYLWRADGKERP